MNLTATDAEEMIKALLDMELNSNVDALICPSFTTIDRVSNLLKGSKISLGSQNVSEYEDGAYTGEISTNMLADLGVEYIIIGHSERRQFFHETDEVVNNKVKRALMKNFKVILCVGESEEERIKEMHQEVVKTQILKGLEGVEDFSNVIIAYEPIWAIGTGKTCESKDAQEMCKFIRQTLSEINKAGSDTRILYGGSVKPSNVSELMKQEDIDGALVGGASLKSKDFAALVNYEV